MASTPATANINMATTPEFDAQTLIAKVQAYIKDYMSHYDGSHDYTHIQRVTRLTQQLYTLESTTRPSLDPTLITLSAYLHDMGDKKYLKPGQDHTAMVRDLLLDFGAPAPLAETVQTICLGVSYSSEIKNREGVQALVERVPELGVVQDADRLDAIGAVGIGRTFLFSGARRAVLRDSVEHFDEKLLLLEGMMKTEAGREMARERTERLRKFKEWWVEEVGAV